MVLNTGRCISAFRQITLSTVGLNQPEFFIKSSLVAYFPTHVEGMFHLSLAKVEALPTNAGGGGGADFMDDGTNACKRRGMYITQDMKRKLGTLQTAVPGQLVAISRLCHKGIVVLVFITTQAYVGKTSPHA